MQDEHAYKFLRLDLRILNGCIVKLKQDFVYFTGEHLDPVIGSVLILIKFVCFVINVVSVLINVYLLS